MSFGGGILIGIGEGRHGEVLVVDDQLDDPHSTEISKLPPVC